VSAEKRHYIAKVAHIFPPNSLICIVTTASPIQTRAKTPEKTAVFCAPDAVKDSSRLKSRQNMRGPLAQHKMSIRILLEAVGTFRSEILPKVPVPQTLTHTALKHYVYIWPSSSNPTEAACKTVTFAHFCASDTSTSL